MSESSNEYHHVVKNYYEPVYNPKQYYFINAKYFEDLFEVTGAEKHGFFTADFKEDENGTAYLTEINARMVAFNLSFAKAGANFAEDIIRLVQEDPTFNRSFKMYEFEPGTVFLRDVDAEPILMNEGDIL